MDLQKRIDEDQKIIEYLKKHIVQLQEEISSLKLDINNVIDNDHYHMVSPNIAVGDIDSSYTDFDIIFDLSFFYETPYLKKHDIKEKNGIIRIAMIDDPSEEAFMLNILERYVPFILQQVDQGKKILIHCFAGVSRSSSLAIACIAQQKGLSFESSLDIVKSIRQQIKPNQGFCNAIKNYLNK